jgi:NADP-dependent 3-hydroxy acid dehydrogenase YdfG
VKCTEHKNLEHLSICCRTPPVIESKCVMVSSASKGMGGDTIRAKLLNIGAAVVCNTRRVRMLLASSHPLQHIFMTAARELAAP